ncbi:MAG TPA: hypothetical protein VKT73_14035 [Xanthobacteraceae bacterium]|nr:hypothetical protein [Xanthobacteraceae bacterium]
MRSIDSALHAAAQLQRLFTATRFRIREKDTEYVSAAIEALVARALSRLDDEVDIARRPVGGPLVVELEFDVAIIKPDLARLTPLEIQRAEISRDRLRQDLQHRSKIHHAAANPATESGG